MKSFLPVVSPSMRMIHSALFWISRLLNGRTRTATFTDDILLTHYEQQQQKEAEKVFVTLLWQQQVLHFRTIILYAFQIHANHVSVS